MRDRDLKVEGKLQLCLIIKCRYSKGHLIKFQIKETNHSIIHLILTVLQNLIPIESDKNCTKAGSNFQVRRKEANQTNEMNKRMVKALDEVKPTVSRKEHKKHQRRIKKLKQQIGKVRCNFNKLYLYPETKDENHNFHSSSFIFAVNPNLSHVQSPYSDRSMEHQFQKRAKSRNEKSRSEFNLRIRKTSGSKLKVKPPGWQPFQAIYDTNLSSHGLATSYPRKRRNLQLNNETEIPSVRAPQTAQNSQRKKLLSHTFSEQEMKKSLCKSDSQEQEGQWVTRQKFHIGPVIQITQTAHYNYSQPVSPDSNQVNLFSPTANDQKEEKQEGGQTNQRIEFLVNKFIQKLKKAVFEKQNEKGTKKRQSKKKQIDRSKIILAHQQRSQKVKRVQKFLKTNQSKTQQNSPERLLIQGRAEKTLKYLEKKVQKSRPHKMQIQPLKVPTVQQDKIQIKEKDGVIQVIDSSGKENLNIQIKVIEPIKSKLEENLKNPAVYNFIRKLKMIALPTQTKKNNLKLRMKAIARMQNCLQNRVIGKKRVSENMIIPSVQWYVNKLLAIATQFQFQKKENLMKEVSNLKNITRKINRKPRLPPNYSLVEVYLQKLKKLAQRGYNHPPNQFMLQYREKRVKKILDSPSVYIFRRKLIKIAKRSRKRPQLGNMMSAQKCARRLSKRVVQNRSKLIQNLKNPRVKNYINKLLLYATQSYKHHNLSERFSKLKENLSKPSLISFIYRLKLIALPFKDSRIMKAVKTKVKDQVVNKAKLQQNLSQPCVQFFLSKLKYFAINCKNPKRNPSNVPKMLRVVRKPKSKLQSNLSNSSVQWYFQKLIEIAKQKKKKKLSLKDVSKLIMKQNMVKKAFMPQKSKMQQNLEMESVKKLIERLKRLAIATSKQNQKERVAKLQSILKIQNVFRGKKSRENSQQQLLTPIAEEYMEVLKSKIISISSAGSPEQKGQRENIECFQIKAELQQSIDQDQEQKEVEREEEEQKFKKVKTRVWNKMYGGESFMDDGRSEDIKSEE